MKTKGFILLILLFGCIHTFAASQTAPRKVKQYTIEQFLATIGLNGSAFSSDDQRIAFSSNQTGIYIPGVFERFTGYDDCPFVLLHKSTLSVSAMIERKNDFHC